MFFWSCNLVALAQEDFQALLKSSSSLCWGKLYLAVLVVEDFLHLHTSQMVLARERRVVMEQIPLPLMLDNRMVRRPSQHWLQNSPTIRKRANWVVTNSIAQVMRISSRVREIV